MPIIVDKEKVRMEILLAFQRCIEKKPIDKVTLRDIAAEAMMILISGTFICNYNRALTGRMNGGIISSIANLAKS